MSFSKKLLIGETYISSARNRNISHSQKIVDQKHVQFSDHFEQKQTNQKEHHQPKCAVDHRSLNNGTLTTIRWSSCNCNCDETSLNASLLQKIAQQVYEKFKKGTPHSRSN